MRLRFAFAVVRRNQQATYVENWVLALGPNLEIEVAVAVRIFRNRGGVYNPYVLNDRPAVFLLLRGLRQLQGISYKTKTGR